VVRHVDEVEKRIVFAVVLADTAGAFSMHGTSQNLELIWLLHWPACMCITSREEAA
jgi:hypothetical protein